MHRSEHERKGSRVRPLRIALTGGIAVGKSSVEDILREEGVSVLDTDSVAHQCLLPAHPAYEQIVRVLGEAVIGSDGSLDRGRIGSLVFHDEVLRDRLNRIVHPFVKVEVQRWLGAQGEAGEHGVVAVPLLFEAGMASGWDCIVCVDASEEVALQRLALRGLSSEEARARMNAQLPQDEKRRRADRVIENNGSLEDLRENVLNTWREITQKEQDHE